MLIRKEYRLTQINSSHHLFSPGRDPAAEQGLAVRLPVSIGTTELGEGDGPPPATPSSNVTTNTPCPRLNLRQGVGKCHVTASTLTRWPAAVPRFYPQMGAGASLLPWAMEVAALTHKVWVKRAWLCREGGRERHGRDETNRGWERLATALHRKQAEEKRGK